jgi:hypothetical protein
MSLHAIISMQTSLITIEMHDINTKVKDLQRESYFLSLERNRKKALRQRLQEELEVCIETKLMHAAC